VLAARLDRTFGICVWYFGVTSNSDADFERYVESFARADEIGAAISFPSCGLLYVEPENPMPNAKWRKRIAEASRVLKSKPSIVFASPSPLVRGIVTAINWLRPPPFAFQVTSSLDLGIAWLEERRGAKLPRIAELLEECRAEIRAASLKRA
jgi:hypothetical protein